MNVIWLAMMLLRNKDVLAKLKETLGALAAQQPQEEANGHTVGSVEWLQDSLNSLSDANLEVDGDYGEKTQQAVAEYQMAQGLAVDGWAGPETINSIIEQLAA